MPPPTLPPELFDIIIDHLHSDLSALRACSLVCRAWLPSCRYHLFNSVYLDLSLPSKVLEPFFNLLTYPNSPFHTSIYALSLRHTRDATQHLFTLGSLRSLKRLTLINWKLSQADVAAFSGSGALHRVKELTLSTGSIDFPAFIDLAQHLPALETLTLVNFAWKHNLQAAEAAKDYKSLPRLFPCLRVLHLSHHSHGALPALAALVDGKIIRGKVETVQADEIGISAAGMMGYLLKALGPSLKHFDISAKTTIPYARNTFALRHNQNLESIRFMDLVDPEHGYGHDAREQFSIDWVIHLIWQVSTSLEKIIFEFWLVPGDRLGLEELKRGEINWPWLRRALIRLPRLRRIEFRFMAKGEHRQWLERKICERLLGLKHVLAFGSLS